MDDVDHASRCTLVSPVTLPSIGTKQGRPLHMQQDASGWNMNFTRPRSISIDTRRDLNMDRGGIRLPNAVHGKVVTRFPPEPSWVFDVGHAKAALMNEYIAKTYQVSRSTSVARVEGFFRPFPPVICPSTFRNPDQPYSSFLPAHIQPWQLASTATAQRFEPLLMGAICHCAAASESMDKCHTKCKPSTNQHIFWEKKEHCVCGAVGVPGVFGQSM